MHLKRLIVSGFKSFADRVTLNFGTGVTGIVGPNGSGKSNVIDAVRWVMGEQNAKNLRGETATDIIFAGSEKRKPLAMCEVTLVFDNADMSELCPPEYRHEQEISLSRRLYSNGEREYLINKKECRLKDILNFFTATGLGGRSYSMIQQGQVDRILNAKPEDVREILEEAAGTLFYRQRKADAQKRLDSTHENLKRLDDLLGEITRQTEGLREQAEKAAQWKDLSDDLQKEEISLFAHNWLFYKRKLEDLEKEITKESDKDIATHTSMAEWEARRIELQNILTENDPEFLSMQERLTEIREQIARQESMMKSYVSRISLSEERLKGIDKEIEEDSESVKSLELEVERQDNEKADLQKQKDQSASILESLEERLSTLDESLAVYDGKIDELKIEFANTDRLIQNVDLKEENLKKELQRINKEQKDIHAKIEEIKTEEKTFLASLKPLEDKLENSQSGLKNELSEKHQLETVVASRHTDIFSLNEKRTTLREEYIKTKTIHNSLVEFGKSETSLTQKFPDLKEDLDSLKLKDVKLLSSHISFNENSEELSKKALAAFEAWAERLVVPSISDSAKLSDILQKHELFSVQASCLEIYKNSKVEPLDDFKKKYEATEFSQFVDIKQKNSDFKFLLSRLLYIPGLKLEETILNDIPSGYTIITGSGLTSSGQGDFIFFEKSAQGQITKQTEIKKLDEQITHFEKALGELQSKIDQLDFEQNKDRIRLAEIDDKLKTQNSSVWEVSVQTQKLQHEISLCQQKIISYEENLKNLDERIESHHEEINNLEKLRKDYSREKKQLDQEMKGLEEENIGVIEEREELQNQLQAKKVDTLSYDAKIKSLDTNSYQMRSQFERAKLKLHRRLEEKEISFTEIEQAKKEIISIQNHIEKLVLEREELDEKILKRREVQSHLHEELKVIEERLKTAREKKSEIEKKISEKNLALERLKLLIQGAYNQIFEKYQIKLESFVFEEDLEFDPDKKAKQVQRIRAKIEAMGPINMMAIEEFKALEEREKFISSQKTEVLDSINVILQAIAEIDLSSKERFMGIYEKINQEFSGLFPVLFPGGEARLELTMPDDPLNGGVEMMVRLPGKKMQRMNLFSGGEKALTAISLIFALLKTKPTPFCFLDEVDAPLDEANVGRFNRVISTLSEQFQFIIITHNRRTMEVLDTLYGVTMQEPGVSKILGVDLEKDIPDHLKKAFVDNKPAPASQPASREIDGASVN